MKCTCNSIAFCNLEIGVVSRFTMLRVVDALYTYRVSTVKHAKNKWNVASIVSRRPLSAYPMSIKALLFFCIQGQSHISWIFFKTDVLWI